MERGNSQQDFASPEEAVIAHYGVKGMRWGVRKEEETSNREPARLEPPKTTAKRLEAEKAQGLPSIEERIAAITRTDTPQVLGASQTSQSSSTQEKKGLSREQKLLITFGVAGAAAAGYYAYTKYQSGQMPGLKDFEKAKQEVQILEGMKLPSKWDVSGLKNGPISTTPLGHLGDGEFNARLLNPQDLVINTSRGYADILPKNGLSNPFAVEQHASVTRVLEEMRDKYPAIRNMNIEVVPFSHVAGVAGSHAQMCVQTMRAGEARVMYNDLPDALPSASTIRANAKYLPGLGKKDYVAYHEMGHLLAAAHGDLPATFDLLSDGATPQAWRTWQKAEPLLHKRTFLKHGFTFKELSKISGYAATQPAEAMAELVGHYHHPEMRKKLTPDQLKRAKAMIDEMGGLT
jgi:hypothetical protein